MTGSEPKVVYTHRFHAPIGELHVAVDRRGNVLRVGFEEPHFPEELYEVEENKYACGEVEYQLERYFAGELRRFTVSVQLSGTEFQRAVWNRLLKIQYGGTMSYGQVAQKIGRGTAARAVGNAVAQNPVPILVPCHRVLPASGEIGHYALRTLGSETGAEIKRTLLSLEGAIEAERAAV
jgi:methylated-DNA-[protein]-cysteine S-methyltransferase